MSIRNTVRPTLLALVASMAAMGYAGGVCADDNQDTAAMKEQMRILMQRIDDLTRQVQELSKQQGQAPAVVAVPPSAPAGTITAPASAPVAAAAPAVAAAAAEPRFDAFMKDFKASAGEPKLAAFLKGFYGTLDVSFDDTTKGINGLTADAYSLANPANPAGGYVNNGPKGQQQVGRLGYMPALSTNKSQIGYRFAHQIDDTDINFMVQVETSLAITASPGLKTSYTQQSNVVQGAIGLGDTFVGLGNDTWGKLKFGTTYAPYKKSTDRMNPFSGMLGDYAAVMGNTGGDNRVEFGTRLDHSVWYESPKIANMFSFDLLWSPGQNRTYDNVVQSAGSPDCSGGNTPGSGNLLLNCDDGGFGDAYSADLRFDAGGFYATVAYEMHRGVNRNSDGIGANNPIYGYLVSAGSPLIDFNGFNAIVAEYTGYAGVASPAYLTDIADETAFKVGAQYAFAFGLTASAIWEELHRNLPQDLEFQNERQRNGLWFALSQDFTSKDNVSVGWAHAGRSVGDPGGQHNYDPLNTNDSADMFTVAWKHQLDKHLTWYVDSALTNNHGNAHYDIGAGGRGLTTDCHDGTNTIITDYSSAGPTTWGGCHIMGYSTGMNYKF
jgi:predicted porin